MTDQTAQRPEWLPEKFATPEDLAKSYTELEAKLGQNTQPPTTPNSSASPLSIPSQPATPVFDVDAIRNEYLGKGELSPETYTKLQANGFTKDFVDNYIAGQVALKNTSEAAAYESVGGKENFAALTAWAAANLSPTEINVFNKAMAGTPEQIRFAVDGLAARYTKANGQAPSVKLSGGAHPGNQQMGYASKAEMVKDMQSAEYQKDPSFRAKVEAKLAATTAW